MYFLYRPPFAKSLKKSSVEKERINKEEAKTDTVKKACKLLSKYCKTFNNKDRGKNLIHKLLLENRLHFALLSE